MAGRKPAPTTAEEKAKAEAAAKDKARKHLDMLRKQSSQRIPRVCAAILSVGALATHNPTTKQAETILATLQNAVNEVKDRLSRGISKKPAFTLPD